METKIVTKLLEGKVEDGDWLKFKEWVEEHFRTLRQVDLIDMKEAERDLLNSIHSEGVVLYERKN